MAEINVLVTEEKLFISLMINLCDKFSDVLEVSDILFDQSLENAHNAYPEATPLIHSDRWFAHIREAYKTKLDEYKMSRVSKCIDNGVCEGF